LQIDRENRELKIKLHQEPGYKNLIDKSGKMKQVSFKMNDYLSDIQEKILKQALEQNKWNKKRTAEK